MAVMAFYNVFPRSYSHSADRNGGGCIRHGWVSHRLEARLVGMMVVVP